MEGSSPKLDGMKLENYGVKNHHIPKIFKRQSYVVFYLVSPQFFLISFDFSDHLIKKSSFYSSLYLFIDTFWSFYLQVKPDEFALYKITIYVT